MGIGVADAKWCRMSNEIIRGREVVSADVMYDYHVGGPYPTNVRVLFRMRDTTRTHQREYVLLFDPSRPEDGAQQWIGI